MGDMPGERRSGWFVPNGQRTRLGCAGVQSNFGFDGKTPGDPGLNLKYLGDALDHWKGSLFESLLHGRLLNGFCVDAMASDTDQWQIDDWSLLARLLRIQPAQIVRHTTSIVQDRRAYFAEIDSNRDLFLDPDTGLATGKVKGKNKSQYLMPDELLRLVDADESRVIAVYQHIRAEKTRARLEKVVTSIRSHSSDFDCASYESGTVAMLFFSRNPSRVKAIADHFRAMLGRHAPGRINHWGHRRPPNLAQ